MEWKIISIVAPSVPMWEVWYDEDEGELFTRPVLVLGLAEPFHDEEDREKAEVDREVLPMTLQSGSIYHAGYPGDVGVTNMLGYSFSENPEREEWKHEINEYTKKGENR